jgi:hypothetical protein
MWRTKLTSIAEEPATSTALLIHDLNTGSWMTFPDETPFRYLFLSPNSLYFSLLFENDSLRSILGGFQNYDVF